jgi:glycosyltransferase involved in cell wall biosynthesis
MRINFLLPCFAWGPSGGFKVVYEYANRLVARGHRVSVIHPRRLKFPPPEKLTPRKRLRIARLWFKEIRSEPVVHWHRLDSRVRLLYVPSSDQGYIPDGDILFATAWHTVRSVMACPATKGEKCYLIQHYETWQGPQSLVDETWRSPLRKVVVSKWLAELGQSLGCGDLAHIPIGIDHDVYRVTHPIEQRERRVAMMFSCVPFKASADGIKALEIAKQQFPDLQAILFGTSRRRPSIPGWMTYLNDPPQQHLIENVLNTCSIVLSPSLAEGFGLPPAEGAACGCAMVATDSGGVRDFIVHGETGLLSPPSDPGALARNLCLLLREDDRRIRLAEAGRRFVERFNWEHSADLLESFLNRGERNQVFNHSTVAVTPPPQMRISPLEMN